MYNITDKAVECVKVIVDNNRCETCDNLEGARVRYQCGHCYCGDCVAKLEHCLVCQTPPGAGKNTSFTDKPAAQRADNAAKLLKTFQEAFNVDVYIRSRISDQLRVEKEVFPDCIQAPVKYHNKRKSSIVQSNKENRWQSCFPGELVSPVKAFEMENSLNYVQHWLDSSEKDIPIKTSRKVFADLEVNSPKPLKRHIPKTAKVILNKDKKSVEITPNKRKKTSLALVKNQSLLDKYIKSIKSGDKQKEFQNIKKGFGTSPKANTTKIQEKADKDESGIVIDDDDLIVIDDSHSQVVDKDKLAWQAVLEANEKSPYVSQSLNLEQSDVIKNTSTNNIEHSFSYNKVPFIRRSYLTETCNLCIKSKSETFQSSNQVAVQPDDVSITIESNTLKATIKMISVKDRPAFGKHSVSIQTDIDYPVCYNDDLGGDIQPQKQIDGLFKKPGNASFINVEKEHSSQDLFTAEIQPTTDQKSKSFLKQASNPSAQLIIEDSDSDDATNKSNIIQVSAEVHHHSEIEPQILAEIMPSDVQQRMKRNIRDHTPNSTDSSDKENFDPNRSKRLKLDKKSSKKRKICNKIKKCC